MVPRNSNTFLGAELGMHPLKTNRDRRKLKWQYRLLILIRNMPKKRLPAIVDRAVWEKATKGQPGIRWDSVVEKTWKYTGGNREEMMSAEKFGRYKAEVEEG